MDKYDFIKEAVKLAKMNVKDGKGGPFGAVIVKDGKIIVKAVNRVIEENDPTSHAEIVAIREACKILNSYQLDDCEIYASCQPCPMCLGAIFWARPKKIYYACTMKDAELAGFDDKKFHHEISLHEKSREIPSEHVVIENSQEPFELWNELEDRFEY
ncbi:nucleoside deaminase [Bacteroidota bacterium]